jgi:hypothetical protein
MDPSRTDAVGTDVFPDEIDGDRTRHHGDRCLGFDIIQREST